MFGVQSSFQLLDEWEFRRLFVVRFIYAICFRMVPTVIAWRLYELTRDPLILGLMGLVVVVPAIVSGLYAGHKIDVSEKRNLLVIWLGVNLFGIIAPAIVSIQMFAGQLSQTSLVVCYLTPLFLSGVARSFCGPLFVVLTSLIVPVEQLKRAASLNASCFMIGAILGHASAGLLIALLPYYLIFALVGCLYATTILLTLGISKREVINPSNLSVIENIKEGISFLLKSRVLYSTMLLDLFAVLFGGVVAMIPVYARDVLFVDSIRFGWLNAGVDLGSLVGTTLLVLFPVKRSQGQLLLYCVGGFGLCTIIFGLSSLFWLSFLTLIVAGVLDGISVVIRQTLLQLLTPVELQGRVGAIRGIFVNLSNELGQFESGFAARVLGVVPSVVFGGTITLIVTGYNFFRVPELRKIEF